MRSSLTLKNYYWGELVKMEKNEDGKVVGDMLGDIPVIVAQLRRYSCELSRYL